MIVDRYVYLQGSSLALLIIDNTFLCFMDLLSYLLYTQNVQFHRPNPCAFFLGEDTGLFE